MAVTDARRPAIEETGAVIRTSGLTKVYGGRAGSIRAVDALDLEVHRGEIFGLLGPNGAGKTTTVGMLTTRVNPTSGQAAVGGIDVVAEPARAKQVIGVVPQTNTLDRSLNVRENLYFHGRYFGMGQREARRISNELLDRFRLADRGRSEILELSGGLAQRLMLARAVMHRPRVLFLDEPTAGLDPQSRLALWEVIQELHGDGQTVLLTTHYMEEADELCDRVAIMDHGRILALDTPANLKSSVGADAEVTLHVDGDVDDLVAALERLERVTRVSTGDGVVRVYVQGGPSEQSVLAAIITTADAHHCVIRDVGVNEPTLETVFISITGKDLRE